MPRRKARFDGAANGALSYDCQADLPVAGQTLPFPSRSTTGARRCLLPNLHCPRSRITLASNASSSPAARMPAQRVGWKPCGHFGAPCKQGCSRGFAQVQRHVDIQNSFRICVFALRYGVQQTPTSPTRSPSTGAEHRGLWRTRQTSRILLRVSQQTTPCGNASVNFPGRFPG